MKTILLAILLISSAYAEIFEVHSVVQKESEPQVWIVKMMDGRVGFWNEEEDSVLDPRKFANAIIDAELSPEAILTGVRIVGYLEAKPVVSSNEKILPVPPYTPTIYPTYNFATDVLSGMRRQWVQGSQCYDRSHVWAYEEMYQGRYLQKAFLFFSDAYISRYNFQWWFHTAPYAKIRLNGEIVERIMDPAFTQYPLKEKLWTDIFMKNKAQCRLIEKYTDYSRRPGEDDCYLMKASIYFWQPKDLEAYERTNVEKKKFIDWEIRHAYQNAFGLQI